MLVQVIACGLMDGDLKYWGQDKLAAFCRHFLMSKLQLALIEMSSWEFNWWQINIGLCNGLEPWGNKPLPQPVLAEIYDTKWPR